MSNIYLIEDNLTHLTYIKKNLIEHLKNIDQLYTVNEVNNISKFYKEISIHNILDTDIFFIDIQLNHYFNGIDLAKKIRECNLKCFIIFITAESNRSLEIIENNISPFGYILKDNKQLSGLNKQINEILDKVIFIISSKEENVITLKNFNMNLVVSFKEINYFSTIKGNRYHTYLQTYKEEYVLSEPLVNVKKNKFPDYYISTLKSYIINGHQIKFIDRKLGKIIFRNDKELYLSSLLINKVIKKLSEQQRFIN